MKNPIQDDSEIVSFVSKLWNENYDIDEIAESLDEVDLIELMKSIQHWRMLYGEDLFPYRVRY